MESQPLIYFFKKCKLLLAACIFLFLQSSSVVDDIYFYNETNIRNQIKLGDFIVRQGTAYESEIIKKLSDSKYSHIGLIVQINPQILIIHAATDDKSDKPNQVILSTLSEFINPKLARGWAIYRNDKLTNQEIDFMVKNTKRRLGEPFYLATKNESKQGVYCTTLIANYLPIAIYQQLQWQIIDVPSLHGEILYPKALIDEAIGSRLIYQE